MKQIILKSVAIILLSVKIFLVYLGSVSQAEDKPQEAMDRVRLFSIGVLEKALRSENAFIRSAAARAAGESEHSELIPFLKKAAKDPYHTTRLFALQGIKKISLDEARSLAISMTEDLNVWVRGAAIEVLGDFSKQSFSRSVDFFDLNTIMSSAVNISFFLSICFKNFLQYLNDLIPIWIFLSM